MIKTIRKTRIALFGSYYRGYHVLKELLYGELNNLVDVVGVATDNPLNSFISPDKRVWQYPYTEEERSMVSSLAKHHNIVIYTERVKTDLFYTLFENEWHPDICITATFGQLINQRLFNYPKLGFYNLHPCFDETWPSYEGGNPFKKLLDDKRPYAVIAMHHVDAGFDTGKLIGFSERIPIPQGIDVVGLHKLTSPIAARYAISQLKKIIFNNYQAVSKSNMNHIYRRKINSEELIIR